VAALPAFGLLMFGSIVAVLIGWKVHVCTWLVLGFITYVTFADLAAAFTINNIFISAFAVLAVVPKGAYWSVGPSRPIRQSVWPIRILQAALLTQYCTAGLCKVLHGTWLQQPLTLWTQTKGVFRTDLDSWMLRSIPLGMWSWLQYGALAFELLAPVLFVFRRLRPIALFWGVAFHLGIALTMKDLIYFSLQMLCFYVLFLDDTFLHAVRERLLPLGKLLTSKSAVGATRDAQPS
jgi:hypothetical protein